MNRKWIVVFFGALGIVQAYIIAWRLPPEAATHFDAGGRPNGWMDPYGFFYFMTAMYAVITASFTLVPMKLRWMNIPHKEYWLAPERREETVKFIVNGLANMGVATQLFMMAVAAGVYQANIHRPAHLNTAFLIVVAVFVVYALAWSVQFYKRFRQK